MKQGRPSLVRLGHLDRKRKADLRISLGCRLEFEFPKSTPLIAMLNVDSARYRDLERLDYLTTSPCVPIESYRDSFGNWCSRMTTSPGTFTLATHGIFLDSGNKDPVFSDAYQHAVEDLPSDTFVFLLGSRYCDRISCRKKLGGCLEIQRLAGPGYRPFVTTCTNMWSSAMSMRERPAQRPRH